MRPVVTTAAGRIYAAIRPLTLLDASLGYPLLRFVDGPGFLLQRLHDLIEDQVGRPGWSTIVDVDVAPPDALPWLAQLVGVRLPASLTVEQRRAMIRDTPGFARGTPAALRAAAQRFLIGTKRVDIIERDGSPYRLRVHTYRTETPGPSYNDLAAAHPTYTALAVAFATYDDMHAEGRIRQALAAAKPAGLILTYSVLLGAPA